VSRGSVEGVRRRRVQLFTASTGQAVQRMLPDLGNIVLDSWTSASCPSVDWAGPTNISRRFPANTFLARTSLFNFGGVCTSAWTLPATAAAEPRSDVLKKAPCRFPACPPAAMAPCEWGERGRALGGRAPSRARRLCPSGGAQLRTKPRRAGAFPALSALASAPFQCISVTAASPAAASSSADAAERGLAWPIGAAPYASLFPPAIADPAAKFSRPGPSKESGAISWTRCSRRPHGRQLAQMRAGGLPARDIWPAPGRPRRQSLLRCIVAAPGARLTSFRV